MRDGAVGLGRISPKVPRPLVQQLDALRRRSSRAKIGVPGMHGGDPAQETLRAYDAGSTGTQTRPCVDDDVLRGAAGRDPCLDLAGLGFDADELAFR